MPPKYLVSSLAITMALGLASPASAADEISPIPMSVTPTLTKEELLKVMFDPAWIDFDTQRPWKRSAFRFSRAMLEPGNSQLRFEYRIIYPGQTTPDFVQTAIHEIALDCDAGTRTNYRFQQFQPDGKPLPDFTYPEPKPERIPNFAASDLGELCREDIYAKRMPVYLQWLKQAHLREKVERVKLIRKTSNIITTPLSMDAQK